MYLFLIIFLTSTLSLFAGSKQQRLLAVTEGEPSALVAGCVNVITGDLYLAEEDVVVQGYVPLRLPRHYIRDDAGEELAGWAFIDHLQAQYKGGPNEHRIKIQDPNGSTYYFCCSADEVERRFKSKTHPPKFRPPSPSETLGLTNTSQGKIGASNNLKNACVRLEEKGKYLTVHCPDKTTRRYKIYDNHKNFKLVFERNEEAKRIKYFLESETLPSGHRVLYHYDHEGRIERICTTNPSGTKTYASASFRYLHRHKRNGPDVDILLSDGRTLSYRFENKHHGSIFLLNTIISPESPQENLYYYPRGSHGSNLISRITAPENRFLEVDYYEMGRNPINGIHVDIGDQNDARLSRVRSLKAPVGQDTAGHMTHRFFYDLIHKFTDVRLPDKLTRYWHDSSLRLTTIDYYGKHDAFEKKETLEWTESGDLLARNVFDAQGRFLLSKRFRYDSRGNVIQEDLSGDLSGVGAQEVYTIRREYSQDNRDLLLKEEEQNGRATLYTYIPNTNLLSARLICEGNQIRIRTFYEYNGDNVLIKEINDDGSTSQAHDLSKVTTRTIKLITPLPEGPFIDMPGTIEERYWDGSQEQLLRKTRFTYTTGGRIQAQEVYDSFGTLSYILSYEYDSFGRIIRETNALGQSSLYTYDKAGNRKTSSTLAQRRLGTITYDYSNRPIQLEEVGFDGISRTTRYAYDLCNRKIAETNYLGNTTQYVYDTSNNLIGTHLPQVSNAAGQFVSPTTASTYDCLDRETIRTDAQGNTIQTAYNARSQATWIRYPDGSEERFLYNIDGTLKTYIDREGLITSHVYDAFGRRIRTIDPNGSSTVSVYNSLHLIAAIDAEGNTTRYSYDGAGRKIAEERQGESATLSYDRLSRLHSVTKGDLINITEYDLLDRTLEERQEDTQGNLISQITYIYDEAGNRTSSTRYQMGKESKDLFTYDAFDRLITHQDPLGYQTHITYDTSYQNENGQHVLQKITTDPLNRKTTILHDAIDRIVQMQIQDASGSLCLLEKNQYDLNSNLIIQKSTLFPQQTETIIQREYDQLNRLVTLIEPQDKITHYTYTLNGFLKETHKPDGVIITRDYDPNGNLLSLLSSDQSIHYTFTYNRLNQLIESIDQNSQATTQRTLDFAGRILVEKLANPCTVQNDYDLLGRRCQLTLPDQSRILYAYDAAHLKTVSRCDPLGKTLYSHLYQEYDLSHNLLSQQLIGTLGTVASTVNLLGQKDSIESPFYSQHVLTRDPLGHILSMKTSQDTFQYRYDPLHQLIEENGHTYSYDSHFNRLEKDGQPTRVNALNQLTDAEYDPNGNLLRHRNITYTYDALDRLLSIETPEQRFVFTYDSFHRRLSKTIYLNNQLLDQSFYIYDGFNEIGSVDSSGKIRELRVLGASPTAETGATIAIELNNQIFAPISDLRGNIVALINLNGALCESYQYTTFGEHTAKTKLNNPWRFASKRLDETGLIYYGRRYYDPAAGRWTTPDPLGLSEGINLYAFVRNNPLTHLDLYGLMVNPPPIEVPMIRTPPIHFPMQAPPLVSTRQVAAAPLPSAAPQSQSRSFGSKAKASALGVGAGTATVGFDFIHTAQIASFYISTDDMGFSPQDLLSMRESLAESQAAHFDSMNSWITSTFDLDPLDYYYTGFRDGTQLGLEVGSLAVGGYGLVKGGMAIAKFGRISAKMPKLANQIKNSAFLKTERTIGKLETFLGQDVKLLKNNHGDLVIESKDGLRQFRMDLDHPLPHKNPHTHLIEYEMKKNRKFEIMNRRIYPLDVRPE